MCKRVIQGSFILLACLMVRTACTQNSALSAEPLPKTQPVIYGDIYYGDIYSLKADAQGCMAFFFAGKRSVRMDEGCEDDLNCTMQKYRTGAVAVNSKGVLLVPQEDTEPEETTGDNGGFIFPSRTMNTLAIVSTRSQAVFISTRQSEMTTAPASFTLHSGHPVVDQTWSRAFINRETISQLASTITTTMDLLSTPGRLTERFTQVEPAPARTTSVFLTVTEEAEGISGLLASMGAVPTSVEVEQGGELELRQGHRAVRLETSTDILEIGPTPTYTSTYSNNSQWTFTVREVSNTASDSSSKSEPEATPASTEAGEPDYSDQVPITVSQCETVTYRGTVATTQPCEMIKKKEVTESSLSKKKIISATMTNTDASESQNVNEAMSLLTLDDQSEPCSMPDAESHSSEVLENGFSQEQASDAVTMHAVQCAGPQVELTPQQIANQLLTLAKQEENGLSPEQTNDALMALLPQVLQVAQSTSPQAGFKPQAVSSLLWSVATLMESRTHEEQTSEALSPLLALLPRVVQMALSTNQVPKNNPEKNPENK